MVIGGALALSEKRLKVFETHSEEVQVEEMKEYFYKKSVSWGDKSLQGGIDE